MRAPAPGRNEPGRPRSPLPPAPAAAACVVPPDHLLLDARQWLGRPPMLLLGPAERCFLIDMMLMTTREHDRVQRVGRIAVDAETVAQMMRIPLADVHVIAANLSAAGLLRRPHGRYFELTLPEGLMEMGR